MRHWYKLPVAHRVRCAAGITYTCGASDMCATGNNYQSSDSLGAPWCVIGRQMCAPLVGFFLLVTMQRNSMVFNGDFEYIWNSTIYETWNDQTTIWFPFDNMLREKDHHNLSRVHWFGKKNMRINATVICVRASLSCKLEKWCHENNNKYWNPTRKQKKRWKHKSCQISNKWFQFC